MNRQPCSAVQYMYNAGVRNWLTRKPKSEAAKELRYLIGLLHYIKNITRPLALDKIMIK